MGEKAHGMRSINGRYKIDRGRLRIVNGKRNGKAKELICMTHGHELREWGRVGGRALLEGSLVQGRR